MRGSGRQYGRIRTRRDRLLTFTSPLGKDVLLPEHLAGMEGISELFFYQLDLLANHRNQN